MSEQLILIDSKQQLMSVYEQDLCLQTWPISTGKNGMGELMDSECTPRGWHAVHSVIGQGMPVNAVFVAREWTGEIYSPALAAEFPGRDWILTRIIRLEGLEPGRNQGGNVDSLARYIYIHGTPDSTPLGKPGSRGCIRLANAAMIWLADWVKKAAKVYIE